MSWYRTGTINVINGDTAVTGVGTKFASNARVGDGLRTPDGEWYEIVNIASETTIGIFPAYQGITVSGQAYAVAPLQGYVKEAADRLRKITDEIQGVEESLVAAQAAAAAAQTSETNAANSASSASTSETSANQHRIDAQAAASASQGSATSANASKEAAAISEANALSSKNSAAVSEANAAASAAEASSIVGPKITAITNSTWAADKILLTTGTETITTIPVPAYSQDLISSVSAASSRAKLGLKTAAVADIVGTVSQSGGVSTGAILEKGSNGNGNYIKFADGTLICSYTGSSGEANIAVAYFGGTRSAIITWTYPAPFISEPTVTATCKDGSAFGMAGASGSNTTAYQYFYTSITTPTSAVRYGNLIAVGRWY